jgi:hypothetical protein
MVGLLKAGRGLFAKKVKSCDGGKTSGDLVGGTSSNYQRRAILSFTNHYSALYSSMKWNKKFQIHGHTSRWVPSL